MRSVVAYVVTALALGVTVPAWTQPAGRADGGPANATELFAAYESAQYFFQQTEVARRLAALGDPSVIPRIEPYLETSDRRRRCNAAFVLAALGDERGTQVLIGELEDTSLGGRAVDELSPQRQVTSDRYFAALLLGELRAKAAIPALIEATRDSTINYQAAYALGNIGDPSAIAALREMVDAFPDQRIFAAYGLAAIGEQDAFGMLEEEALSNPQWVDRRHAVELLGKTRNPLAVPILTKTLRDAHANIRVSSVRALAEIGEPAALPALQRALNDHEVTQVNAPTTTAAEAQKAIEAIRARAR
jgi:HEAT repeat protein